VGRADSPVEGCGPKGKPVRDLVVERGDLDFARRSDVQAEVLIVAPELPAHQVEGRVPPAVFRLEARGEAITEVAILLEL